MAVAVPKCGLPAELFVGFEFCFGAQAFNRFAHNLLALSMIADMVGLFSLGTATPRLLLAKLDSPVNELFLHNAILFGF